MPKAAGLPPGTLVMLILRVLRQEPLHGYAIAQKIRQLSSDQLSVEEGSLYPALQKLLANGWVKADWATSDTGRKVRSYRMTPKGLKQLEIGAGRLSADGRCHHRDSGVHLMGTFLRRVWHLVNRPRHERELVEEMQQHRGLMHDPATFGNTYRLLERSRDAWGWNWLDDCYAGPAAGRARAGADTRVYRHRGPHLDVRHRTQSHAVSDGQYRSVAAAKDSASRDPRPPLPAVAALEFIGRPLCGCPADRARQPGAVGRAARSLDANALGRRIDWRDDVVRLA